jgi:hypothetical protein
MFVLDVPTALQFTNGSVAAPDLGALTLVTMDEGEYGESMSGVVGFVGSLDESPADADVQAVITISALSDAGISGSYDGYTAYLENDDDDASGVRLYVVDGGGIQTNAWVTLPGYSSAWLTLAGPFNFDGDVTDIGFQVLFDKDMPGHGSDPDFYHISAVPVPGAVLLGAVGLIAAGVRLRRFA